MGGEECCLEWVGSGGGSKHLETELNQKCKYSEKTPKHRGHLGKVFQGNKVQEEAMSEFDDMRGSDLEEGNELLAKWMEEVNTNESSGTTPGQILFIFGSLHTLTPPASQ